MVKFYTDEDVSSWLVQLLRDSNARYDVVTTKSLNNLGNSDADQVLTATQQHRVLVTHNQDDFLLLHLAWHRWSRQWNVQPLPSHAGIVAVPQRRLYPYEQLVSALDQLVAVDNGQSLSNEMYRWHRNPYGWTWERWHVERNQWEPRP